MRNAMLEFDNGEEMLYYFVGGLIFPVYIIAYSEGERQQMSYLKDNFQADAYTTKSMCEWCIRHHIEYYIINPLSIREFLRHPYKSMMYLRLKKQLEYCV